MPSLELRRLASSSARRRSSTSRILASASALARALRSSSVRVRSTTPEPLRAGDGVAARVIGAFGGAALAITGSGAWGVSVAGPSPPTRRLPRFSTTTCLVRPWLKLWRTVPVSTRGLSVKVLVGTLSVLSPGDFVSTIQQSQSCCVVRIRTVVLCRSFYASLCQRFVSEFLAGLPTVLPSSAIRYRTRVWLRDRNVLLAGPGSRAAC